MPNAEELVRMHIGNLITQIAQLQAENYALRDELAKYAPKEEEEKA